MTAMPADWQPGRYRCPVCTYASDSLAAKKAHVKTEHPRPARG